MKRVRVTLPAALRACGAIASGLTLASAFPPFENSQSAWLALAPLMLVARYSAPGEAFKWGFAGGMAFWLIDISWLLRLAQTGTTLPLAILAWLLVSAYSSLYFGAFATLVSTLWSGRTLDFRSSASRHRPEADRRRADPPFPLSRKPADKSQISDLKSQSSDLKSDSAAPDNVFKNIALVIAFPLLWVGLEYLRSTILTGFPWNPLGVSQYKNIAVIQIAELGGVYAVSAVIVAMNTGLAMVFSRFVGVYRRPRAPWRMNAELATGLLILVLAWAYGLSALRRVGEEERNGTEVRVAAIQPNIPQLKKWSDESIADIYEALLNQTECVNGAPGLRLIVWPETSVPGAALTDPDVGDFVRNLAGRGVPILVGSLEVEGTPGSEALYNSSLLFMPNGVVADRYRKRHLVPFGEYLPFDKKIGLIARMAPLGFSCTPGATSAVFRIAENGIAFSSLICFEDTIASLARESARNGAGFLVNQTNDAWFDDSAASAQHMSHCVFRCVENRLWAVRAANTGVTCFIDSAGRVDALKSVNGETRFAGFKIASVAIQDADRRKPTFYTRYGDLPFALPCGIATPIVLVLALLREKRRPVFSRVFAAFCG